MENPICSRSTMVSRWVWNYSGMILILGFVFFWNDPSFILFWNDPGSLLYFILEAQRESLLLSKQEVAPWFSVSGPNLQPLILGRIPGELRANLGQHVSPTISLLQAWQSRAASPNPSPSYHSQPLPTRSFLASLSASHPPPPCTCITSPFSPFLPLHMTKPPQPVPLQNATNCHYAHSISTDLPLHHWPCLTSIHQAASDTAPINLSFQFERRSFESQEGRQIFELLPSTSHPHNHRHICSTNFIQHNTQVTKPLRTFSISWSFLFISSCGNQIRNRSENIKCFNFEFLSYSWHVLFAEVSMDRSEQLFHQRKWRKHLCRGRRVSCLSLNK